MDIHKPHAAHNLREFAVEIGTIVCGILIALGLEQVVEAVHRSGEVREAREALNTEISLNLGAYRHFLAHRTCFNQRLDEIHGWVVSPAAAKARSFPAKLPDPEYILGSNSDWLVASSAVAKMPFHLRSKYGLFYNVFGLDRQVYGRFNDHWNNLARLLSGHDLSVHSRDDINHEVNSIRLFGTVIQDNYSEYTSPAARDLGVEASDGWVTPELKTRAAAMCRRLFPTVATKG